METGIFYIESTVFLDQLKSHSHPSCQPSYARGTLDVKPSHGCGDPAVAIRFNMHNVGEFLASDVECAGYAAMISGYGELAFALANLLCLQALQIGDWQQMTRGGLLLALYLLGPFTVVL